MSAVCVYSLEDITKVMDGPFKELKKSCENWMNPEPVPTPRPGQVHIQSYYTNEPCYVIDMIFRYLFIFKVLYIILICRVYKMFTTYTSCIMFF